MRHAYSSLAGRTGIGLRPEHWRAFAETRPPVGFIEAHSENYFGRGGKPLHFLLLARQSHELSLHGVGLSIGSVDPLCETHLSRLAELVRILEPTLVSDHLCWTSVGGIHANDLLPLPYTEEALAHVVARVQRVQEYLGRPILLENLSAYLDYAQSIVPEWEFLAEVAAHSGCGLLLDINNIHVSAHNLGFDPIGYIEAIPRGAVQEMHLAGFTRNTLDDGAEILIDTHSAPVADAVWTLYAAALERFGAVPTLVEWDADLPPLPALVAEAGKARAMMEARHACAA
ncbi:DUF692 domain-containing protein [Variovorax sp. MHTC-1]|uniref:MNIO family bufferin maturase n=1 Tax=Variovorax sp. MHTC-1 TaxID=2495593 RepID=UPI000F862AA7|nr:DUF692 domain-containing protein [Variovorax sp. MHTC-1]RST50101.1 DUF692 domain-containing protein [Variovorax sp. MHTC-1]